MSNQTITIGNGNTFQGDFVIAEKIRESFNKIGASDSSEELKELLKALSLEVGKVAAELEKKQAEGIIDDLQKFIDEASSTKPKKKWWEISAKGMKETAGAVGELGLSLIKNLDKIIPILEKMV